MVFKGKISPTDAALALYLRKYQKLSFRRIADECGLSKSTVARLCSSSNNSACTGRSVQPKKKGRPRKISPRNTRKLLRTLKTLRSTNQNITVEKVVTSSGLDFNTASRRTFSRCLNLNGYAYLQARKKGLITEKDCKLRLQFARKMKKKLQENPDFFKDEVAFFLDGVSFVHKYNPYSDAVVAKSRVWRKKGEGLQITAKGSKELAGGRRLHLLVAIAYGKGVILKHSYANMNGDFFCSVY